MLCIVLHFKSFKKSLIPNFCVLLSHVRGTTAPLQVIPFIPLYQHIQRFNAEKNYSENNPGYSELRGAKERITKTRYIYTYSSVK